MDTKDFQKRWPEMKEQIKSEHPNMDEKDLDYELGKEIELLERLQKNTGKTKAEIFDWLKIMG